jgi:hypothetical protein
MAMPAPAPKVEPDPAPRPDPSPRSGPAPAVPRRAQAVPARRRTPLRILRYSPHPSLAGIVAAATAVVVAGWLTYRLWADGPLPGDDTMAHLVRAEFGVGWLVPRGRLDGWQTRLGVGYEQYLFLGPGLSWAVAAVYWLSMGLASVATAFKMVVIGSFLALPLAVAFLARSMGLGRRAAGLAVVLSLCVSSPFGGVGIPGTFDIGLVSHQFGAVPTVLALGGMLRVAVNRRLRWMLATAVALAAVLISHAISAIVLAVLLMIILPTLLATDRVTAAAVRRLLTTTGLATGAGRVLAGAGTRTPEPVRHADQLGEPAAGQATGRHLERAAAVPGVGGRVVPGRRVAVLRRSVPGAAPMGARPADVPVRLPVGRGRVPALERRPSGQPAARQPGPGLCQVGGGAAAGGAARPPRTPTRLARGTWAWSPARSCWW